jgi:hypothetical protein
MVVEVEAREDEAGRLRERGCGPVRWARSNSEFTLDFKFVPLKVNSYI